MPKQWLGILAKLYFVILLLCEVDYTFINPQGQWKDIAVQAITGINFLLVCIYFFEMPIYMRVIATGVLALLLSLVIKSYNNYGVPFIYPNVFRKALVPLGVCAGYLLCKEYGKYNIKILIQAIYIFLAVQVVVSVVLGHALVFEWGSENRLLMSEEAGLLLIPLLVHFQAYCAKSDKIYKFAIDLVLVFIAQHRTVWIAAFVGIVLLAFKYPNVNKKLIPYAIAGLLFITVLSSDHVLNSSFITTLQEQVNDIFEFKSQGTGSWRYEQSEFFLVRVAERPFLGWDFEAFELGEVMQVESFGDRGTHIHSAYVDPLYYFGILGGLLMTWLGFLVLALKYFSIKNNLLVIFPVFALCMFSFGTSYQLPLYAYFFCGMGLAYLQEFSRVSRLSMSGYRPAET